MNAFTNLSSSSSKHISLLCSLLSSRKMREKLKMTLLKNESLIQKAVKNKINIQQIYYKNNLLLKSLKALNLSNECKFNIIDNDLSTNLLDIIGSIPELLAVCNIPQKNNFTNDDSISNSSTHDRLPVILICDNIRDHGNMGTILKTFCYLNCRELILTKGSVDIWNPKTLESADGCQLSHYNSITINQTWNDINELIPNNSKIFYAESQKISPIHSKSKECINYKSVEFLSANQGTALIVGGETEGVSMQAKDFCGSRNGCGVFIPLKEGIESLNGGIAAGILLFEMDRQYRSLYV